jgi:hypothetical protein
VSEVRCDVMRADMTTTAQAGVTRRTRPGPWPRSRRRQRCTLVPVPAPRKDGSTAPRQYGPWVSSTHRMFAILNRLYSLKSRIHVLTNPEQQLMGPA